jgi:hypothetical protein
MKHRLSVACIRSIKAGATHPTPGQGCLSTKPCYKPMPKYAERYARAKREFISADDGPFAYRGCEFIGTRLQGRYGR